MLLKIGYVLASILCLSSCTATKPNPQPQKPQKIVEVTPKPPGPFTYLLRDLWPDPYQFVGSVNYSEDNAIIGTGVLITPSLVLTAAHVPEGREEGEVKGKEVGARDQEEEEAGAVSIRVQVQKDEERAREKIMIG